MSNLKEYREVALYNKEMGEKQTPLQIAVEDPSDDFLQKCFAIYVDPAVKQDNYAAIGKQVSDWLREYVEGQMFRVEKYAAENEGLLKEQESEDRLNARTETLKPTALFDKIFE